MWGVSFLDIFHPANILTTKHLLGSLNVFVVTSLLRFILRFAMQCTVFMNNLNQLAFMLLPLLLSTKLTTLTILTKSTSPEQMIKSRIIKPCKQYETKFISSLSKHPWKSSSDQVLVQTCPLCTCFA